MSQNLQKAERLVLRSSKSGRNATADKDRSLSPCSQTATQRPEGGCHKDSEMSTQHAERLIGISRKLRRDEKTAGTKGVCGGAGQAEGGDNTMNPRALRL